MAQSPRRVELAYEEGPSQNEGLGKPSSDAYLEFLSRRHVEEREQIDLDIRRRQQLGATLDDVSKEVRQIVGDERYERLRRYASTRREERSRLFAGRKGARIDTKALMAFDRETRRQAEEQLRGVDAAALDSARAGHLQKIEALSGRDESPMATPVAEADVPEEIRTPTHNPPILRTPPYPWGWAYGTVYYHGGSLPTLTYYADRITGRLGSQMHYHNYSAGDHDYGHVHCRSYFGFDVIPQGTGKWRFWLKIRFEQNSAHFYFDDDFYGFSNTSCYQGSRMIIRISTGPPMNLLYHPDEVDSYWLYSWGGANIDYENTFYAYPVGAVQWFTYTTPYNLSGQAAFVGVGSAEDLDAYVDDTSVNHTLTNSMFLEQVSIQAPV